MRMPFTDSAVFHLHMPTELYLYHSNCIFCISLPALLDYSSDFLQNKEAGNAHQPNPTFLFPSPHRASSVPHASSITAATLHSRDPSHITPSTTTTPTLTFSSGPLTAPSPPTHLLLLPACLTPPSPALPPAHLHRRHPAATGYMRPLNHHHHSAR